MWKNGLLHPSQSGFRKMCSTTDPIIRLKTEIEDSMSKGNITVAILLDVSRAFDLVWVDGMLLKLRQLYLTEDMFWWIKKILFQIENI